MPRLIKYTSCVACVALGVLIAVPQTSAQTDRRVIERDAALPALGPNQLRVVPPTPRVRISGDESDETRAANSRRRARSLPDSPELASDREPAPSRSTSRQPTARTATRSTSRSTTGSTSGSSTSSSSEGTNATPQTFRRAVGDDPEMPDDDIEYGRLIVMTQFDNVLVTIDGQPYPFGSLDGVLLYANEQYEVLLEQAPESGSTSSASSSTQGRVITVRVGPGETRVLLANLGSGTTASPAPRGRTNRRSSSRSRDEDSEEEDEEIGYLGVSSSPRGTVYVDGENTGQTTPARRIQLEPGRHEVRIFYESEERFSETKNVLIRDGVNTNVFFRMRRDEEEDDYE